MINLGGAARGDNFLDAIFKNPGFGSKWIELSLLGTKTNRAAIGAQVKVKVTVEGKSGERTIHGTVTPGGSFGASTLRLEIGLGDAERIRDLEVFWPASGRRDHFSSVGLNAAYSPREGEDGIKKLQACFGSSERRTVSSTLLHAGWPTGTITPCPPSTAFLRKFTISRSSHSAR